MPGSARLLMFGLSLALCACQDEDSPPSSLDGGVDPDVLDAASPPPTAEEAAREAAVPDRRDASADAAPPSISMDASVDAGVDAGTSCSELTYDNFGHEFIYTWCQSCHNQMEPKLTSHELVQLHAIEIRAATVDSERMPAGGGALYLRKAQRDQLGRWLECGAP